MDRFTKINQSTQSTTVHGQLEQITYYNADNHFAIAKFRTDQTDKLITILGTLPNPNLGESLRVTGTWEHHHRFGEQLKIETFEVVLPASVEGIKKYLNSGLIKGIGPKTAARLVSHFGDKTLDIIEHKPQRLAEVKGIGATTVDQITSAWKAHHVLRNLIQVLQEYGLKSSFSASIYRTYGLDSLNVIQETPYRLALDLPRIGFEIADAIALKNGLAVDDPERVDACVLYQLELSAGDGHVCLPVDDLFEGCIKRFGIPGGVLEDALFRLEDSGKIHIEGDRNEVEAPYVYLLRLYEAENGISNKVQALLSVPVPVVELDVAHITETVLKKLAVQLSDDQMQALFGILAHRIAIITGGPGTGKTTLIRSITAIFEMIGKEIFLAAPTGRAARRLSEVVGKKAETIHKLLGFNPKDGYFEKNRDNPLEADGIIIDEFSMVDTMLMYHLLQAIHLNSHIILVGDVFQLPSVGPGNILADMIRSGAITTFELKNIFRQVENSAIVVNAHKIRRGESLDLSRFKEDLFEFRFIENNRPESVVKTVVDLCKEVLPVKLNLDPIKDVQVITPMHRGLVGTLHLNRTLQKALNPNPEYFKIHEKAYKMGDKVMHLVNNYTKEVFNGDIGTIVAIEKGTDTLWVDYDDRTVSYDFSELDEITMAYAISIHKSQGSEYPAVIVPLMTQHFPLLQRNLLYTAVTRGKEVVILVGTTKAIRVALNNDKPQKRISGLTRMLKR